MAVLATDNFNRANGDLVAGSANWSYPTTPVNFFAILTNQLTLDGTAARGAARWNAVAFPNDQYSKATYAGITNAGIANAGVAVRCSTSGANTYYYIQGATNLRRIAKEVAGAKTDLAENGVLVATDIARLSAIGTALSIQVNGVDDLVTATDAAIASGSAGIWRESANSTLFLFEDWEGGDFAVPAGGSTSAQIQFMRRRRKIRAARRR